MENTAIRDDGQPGNGTQSIIPDGYSGRYPEYSRPPLTVNPVDRRKTKRVTGHKYGRVAYDRRVLTYDFYPNDRRKTSI